MSYLLKQSLAFGKQDSFILLLLKQNHVLWISDCILTYNSFRRASCLSFHLFSLNVSCFSLKLLTVFVRSLSPQSWQFAEALYISVFCFFFGGGGLGGEGRTVLHSPYPLSVGFCKCLSCYPSDFSYPSNSSLLNLSTQSSYSTPSHFRCTSLCPF